MKKKLAALTISLSINSLTIGQSGFAPVAGVVQRPDEKQFNHLVETRFPEIQTDTQTNYFYSFSTLVFIYLLSVISFQYAEISSLPVSPIF